MVQTCKLLLIVSKPCDLKIMYPTCLCPLFGNVIVNWHFSVLTFYVPVLRIRMFEEIKGYGSRTGVGLFSHNYLTPLMAT